MSAPGLVVGAKVRCGAGSTLWEVERIDRYSVTGRSANGRRRRIDLDRVQVVEPVPGMETMEVRGSGHIEVDGEPVRYSDDYFRTVVDWPARPARGMVAPQPSSFAVRIEGYGLAVEVDGPCGGYAVLTTHENAHQFALDILELAQHLPE